MAIVEFTCLINRIRGRVGTDVFSFFRGTTFIKGHPTTINDPNSIRQQLIRSNISALSKLWYDIPDETKRLWNSYATKHKGAATGFNHFVSLNANLLNSCHSDLVYRPAPPPRPGTPAHVRGICVFAMSTTQACISWIKPNSPILFVTARYKLHRGFCARHPSYGCCCADGYRPSLRYIETVKSNVGYIVVNHDYPPNTRGFIRLNSLDKYGRKSPVSHFIKYLNI